MAQKLNLLRKTGGTYVESGGGTILSRNIKSKKQNDQQENSNFSGGQSSNKHDLSITHTNSDTNTANPGTKKPTAQQNLKNSAKSKDTDSHSL
jgi:hypothetical protein